MIQAEILERAEGIKREYNELDTVWFMAGSLFQVNMFSVEANISTLLCLWKSSKLSVLSLLVSHYFQF